MTRTDMNVSIAGVRRELDDLAATLDDLVARCETDRDAADLVVVDGPFEGDAPAALDTTRLWLERARVMLSSPARAVADAHVAAGGLAHR